MEQRKGQTFLGLKLSEDLARELEIACNGRDKSQFVREAIAEKLGRMNIRVKEEMVGAPSRKGKGGPAKYAKIKGKPREKKL